MSEKQELTIEELEQVAGGYSMPNAVMRNYVDTLRGFHGTPNLAEGYVINGSRGNLTAAQSGKPRGWLGGTSIDNLVRPFQLYTKPAGMPLNRGF